MELFDTHCHLDVAEFDADREDVIRRARDAGVHGFLVPAVDFDGWDGLLTLCARHDDCHAALGLHPVYIDRHTEEHVNALAGRLAGAPAVAVGEIGLDFALKHLDRDRQLAVFRAQLAIAAAHDLPVVIHCRKAYDELIACLRDTPVPGGICHAFNGSLQQGEQLIDMGLKLGFGGMLTFERSSKLRRLAAELPLDGLVLETDAPDLTVASHQYERNSPEYLPEVLQTLAEVRGLPAHQVAKQTTATARNVFGLKPSNTGSP